MLCKPILHQTTIVGRVCFLLRRCILLKFHIKPQLWRGGTARVLRCILLNFYIKPQLACALRDGSEVVSYWISTSNNNFSMSRVSSGMLYLIEFLHQTTTIYEDVRLDHMLYLIEFLHQTTTLLVSFPLTLLLYLIEFLHQTTTTDGDGK